jgi:uncharacterized protein YndB with AHSA1/START domain
MRRVLLILLLLVAALLVGFGAFGLTLRTDWKVESSIVIHAEPDRIFAYIADLKRWEEWTAWTTARYSDMKREFSGPAVGPGATMHWTGDKSGRGSIKVVAVESGRAIRYELTFDGSPTPSLGAIELHPDLAAGTVRVVWIDQGDIGTGIVARYFVPVIERMILADFEQGLSKLKTLCEKQE